MAKQLSTSFHQTTNKVSAPEYPLFLLQVDHADLAQPIRVVNDRQDVTSNGDIYQKFAFRITTPSDPENGLAEASISFDNIGREMMQWIEIADWNQQATVTISRIMLSAPNVIEWSITMDLSDISVSQTTVGGKLGFENLLEVQGVRVNYTPVTAVGLF